MTSVHCIDHHIGQRAKSMRELLGMSQDVVADSLGVTLQRLRELEHGIVRFGAQELWALAKLLAVSPRYFFEDFNLRPGAANGRREMSRHLV